LVVAGAGASVVVAAVAVGATVVAAGVDFFSYDFQKYITDETKLTCRLVSGSADSDWTWLGTATYCLCARGAGVQFAE
jgi:hypothetical protein